ncbi:SDR family NAD(P)-dependent oxidoreductase [Gorillibacterium sp. sgz500922]|uniref:SDR family NAD(P)-dependent oxidoreductase n=1 Tax=Gorillibacterium sp. sgz500922 TaxID=3446694 RepID=UPI003F66CCC3
MAKKKTSEGLMSILGDILSSEFLDKPNDKATSPINEGAAEAQSEPFDLPQRPDEREMGILPAPEELQFESVEGSVAEAPQEVDFQPAKTLWQVEQRTILEQVKSREITAEEGYRRIAELWSSSQGPKRHLAHSGDEMATGYFQGEWIESEPEARKLSVPFRRILCFAADSLSGNALAAELAKKDSAARIMIVRLGSSFREWGEDRFEINPAAKADYRQLFERLASQNRLPDKIIHGWSRTPYDGKASTVQEQLDHGLFSLFYLTQLVMELKLGHKVALDYVYSGIGTQPQYAAVSGFVKTLRLENPDFAFKTVEIQLQEDSAGPEPGTDAAGIIAAETALGGEELEVRYSGNRRMVKRYRRLEMSGRRANSSVPFKKHGVYLITGGAGGLGMIFAEYLAQQVAATLILVGRSELTKEKKQKIKELETYGSEIVYVSADLARKADVDRLISQVKSRFRRIDGVIHSAGIYQNGLILKKTYEEMEKVLASKVWGTMHLDEALQDEQLDFFVVCSSLAGEFGKVGQSDYAFGNDFLDNFAQMREQFRKQGKRQGKTVAINWPLWENGGMALDEEERRVLREQMGLEPLPTREGLAGLNLAVQHDHAQIIVTYGDQSRIVPFITRSTQQSEAPRELPQPAMADQDLYPLTETLLKDLLVNEIGLPLEKLDSKTTFEAFGIDSIVVNHFNAEIEKKLGALPKTLLFEYRNVQELTEYMVNHQAAKLIKFFAPTERAPEQDPTVSVPAAKGWKPLSPLSSPRKNWDYQPELLQPRAEKAVATMATDIAIIGLSGRYPGAKDLQAFWDNLASGKDCITEIPPERWDWQSYYDSNYENRKEGKMYCKWGGFLEDFDKFEPLFFNISPREAEAMDPQERLFLETVWATLEDAGYNFNKLRKAAPKENGLDVGVFVGATSNTYPQAAMEEWAKGNPVTFTSSPWSIANRVSYVFNFHGPSMPIDTACSSSLIAIHLACESLRSGECSMAVAGGVNLYLHPSKYVSMCQAKMLSPTGICSGFGEQADGMVPGEGVGAVLLKPLDRAVADQDLIYAVIKGSAVNHGGKTNGYSVPNPNAQAGLILDAIQKSGIDPLTIGYIEAHGTGTALGDPVEIAGLTKAMRQYTDKNHFCAIGSVKSNIGHLESAAGIAGLTKILLQMRHRQLLPSIHADRLNPNIDFENSPFWVQRKLERWTEAEVAVGNEMKRFPRRAGISSFGAGGSNAHLLLEDYPIAPSVLPSSTEPQLFLLSAKNEVRLKQYAKRLRDFIEVKLSEKEDAAVDPAALAYTLQVGREPLEERMAIVAPDVEGLILGLTQFLDVQPGPAGMFRGNRKRIRETRLQPSGDQVSQLLHNRELHELGRIWALGADVDWFELYPGERPRTVSLPTYPFSGQRYWFPQTGSRDGQSRPSPGRLHPLLHWNSSTLEEHKYSTLLTGTEFFVDDHRLNGRKVLPGVAFLEMALTAGNLSGNRIVAGMKNVVWTRPVLLEETAAGTRPFQLTIRLHAERDEVNYQVWSESEPAERVVHAQGRFLFADPSQSLETAETIDLVALKHRLSQSMDEQTCYRLYEQSGLHYGPRFRAVRKLYYRSTEVLSILELPQQLTPEFDQYRLNPALLDGALQSIIALKDPDTDDTAGTYVPFELGELRIYGPLPRTCYAHIIMQDFTEGSPVRRYHVRIADEAGHVLVFLKNFSFRRLEQEPRTVVTSSAIAERLYFGSGWDRHQLESPPKPDRTLVVFDTEDRLPAALQQVSGFGTRIVLVRPGREFHSQADHRYEINPDRPDDFGRLLEELQRSQLTPDTFIHRWAQDSFDQDPEVLENSLRVGLYSFFHLVQAVLEHRPGLKSQFLFLYPSSPGGKFPSGLQPQYAAVSGFARTVHAECPELLCRVIEYSLPGNSTEMASLAVMLGREVEAEQADEMEIRYEGTERWVKRIREITPRLSSGPAASRISPIRPEGVYVITGGVGGLGLAIASQLARQGKVRLVLSGRSELDAAREAKIRDLEDRGAEVLYVKADIAKPDEASRLVAAARSRFGPIRGVIHCAGVLRDNSIRRKTLTEMKEVLAPKVFGTLALDAALAEETLDFFVLFSSMAAVTGNPGQSDYAFGNGFMGHYAVLRAQESRLGKVLAIHWPLWEDGGMGVNAATAAMLRGAVGMIPISAASGFGIMMDGLGRPEPEFAVMEGDGGKIRRFFSKQSPPSAPDQAVAIPAAAPSDKELLQAIQQDFASGVAEILKITLEEIDIETELSEFGFDSVTFTQYSNLLNEKFNLGIMPSDLFEYRSLASFSREMLARYPSRFLQVYGRPGETALPENQTVPEAAEPAVRVGPSTGNSAVMDKERLLLNLQRDLLAGVGKILKIHEEDVDIYGEMSELGFDSVTFTQFGNLLNDQFDLGITPSQFFEHRSLDAFSRVMLTDYGPQLTMYYQDLLAAEAPAAESAGKAAAVEDRHTPPTLPDSVSCAGPSPIPVRTWGEDDIAITGISGVMPQSEDVEEFWRHLEAGQDLITEIPQDRWDWRAWYGDPKEHNKTNIKWGGFLKEADKFDAAFFGISPREAEMMDPQQRIFLEVVWKTIEDAGYKASDLAGTKVGLFVGVASADYADILKESGIGIQAQTATGNFHSVLPNRISYLLDFHGPSEPIDTACSSSLVAIHRAVEAIRNGDCSEAIAGGINVIASPSAYITFGKAGMLCEDGRCKTFDQRANGYVRGEGAAAIFLKPLQRAIAEGDHVYGVIRGTAVNHGGHTNSLTAPNPIAQADLLIEAWRKSGVDPRRAAYIEAHGTGTSLGDPIEINGLKKAFDQLYRDWNCAKPETPHCGLGSIKTNIGHLEAAAGIAGVVKVLLAMKHGKLPATIHFQQLNPYIQLQDSPFFIVKETQSWNRLRNENGVEIPRVAGVSSFGFGGVNAHIVIEEGLVSLPAAQPEKGRGLLMVLSAKNADRLRVYAARMLAFFEANPQLTEECLENISYTLQTGRESMNERLAWVASNPRELIGALTAYCSGQAVTEMMQGNIRDHKGKPDLRQSGDGEDSIAGLIERREWTALARLWVQGTDIDWRRMYGPKPPTKLTLPVYPFDKERYWLPDAAKVGKRRSVHEQRHALIDSNESTLDEQCYMKTFHGDEFYLQDHSNILPGVVYMEMLRVAGNLAHRSKQVMKLNNIIWISPIAVRPDEPMPVFIGLHPDGEQVRFEVSTRGYGSAGDEESKTVHCQGRLIYGDEALPPAQAEFVDVEEVKERCRGGQAEADAYYTKLEEMGVHFGSRFKGVQAFYCNRHEALSEVGIPPELEAGVEDYLLHPTLTDGGLQTVVVWAYHNGADPNTVYMPFVMGEIEWIRPGARIAYAYATKAPGQEQLDPIAARYQVWLLDRQGQVVVKLTDYSVSALNKAGTRGGTERIAAADRIYARSGWEIRPQDNRHPVRSEAFGTLLVFDHGSHTAVRLRDRLPGSHSVILVKPGGSFAELPDYTFEIQPDNPEDYRKLLAVLEEREQLPQKVLHLWSQEPFLAAGDALADQLAQGIGSVFHLSRAYMATHPGMAVELLYVYFEAPGPDQAAVAPYSSQPHYSAVGGYAKTNRLENPDLHIKTVGWRTCRTSESSNSGDVEWMLREFNRKHPDEIELRYQEGERWVRTWREYTPKAVSSRSLPLREKGVYLITGGAGGLGLIFAEYLARKCRAKLILTGRTRVLPSATWTRIKELEGLGAEVEYISADLTNKSDVKELIGRVKHRYAGLHGMIHCAGVIRDSLIREKSLADFQAVLAPKVYGAVYLDEATRTEPLDFFALFSSLTAVTGNAGQSDYAYANSFLDDFADWRREQNRSGKTFSINWPLWSNGGMQVNQNVEKMLADLGMSPISNETGLNAFETALGETESPFVFLEGDSSKLRRLLRLQIPEQACEPEPLSDADQEESLLPQIRKQLIRIMARILKYDEAKLKLDDNMSGIGFDSITLTELANHLNATFKLDLTPALFFKHTNPGALAQYLVREHRESVSRYFRAQTPPAGKPPLLPARPEAPPVKGFRSRFESFGQPQSRRMDVRISNPEPVAVIGMSGVMPQSDDLEEFWRNLIGQRDLISEIPKDRWDWEAIYGEPNGQSFQTNVKWGGFIREVDKFDPLFFGIAPLDAELMDPQERIMIEVVWQTIWDAGYKAKDFAGTRTGLFMGVSNADYQELLIKENKTPVVTHSLLANRISYMLDIHGPSEPVDTACSSSLVAVNRAVEAIQSGHCEMALAGGINIIVSPNLYVYQSASGMLSPDGRCKTFDKRANGYVRGEGAGALLLKPLSKALADGDHIYAVIKAASVNHGGHAASLTAPNAAAQADLITGVYRKAGIDPSTVSYIETHGTGTSLGDPVEIEALKDAFQDLYQQWELPDPPEPHCGLGAVKTNIGHLESASGIAGLLKVLLALKYKQLPPILHFEEMNPYIKLEGSPFYIVRHLQRWERLRDRSGHEIPRRAGISSFGIGGVNAHVVLEEYEESCEVSETASGQPQILVFSAKSQGQLQDYLQSMLDEFRKMLAGTEETRMNRLLPRIAYTLQTGRDAMEERLAVVASSLDELVEKLQGYRQGNSAVENVFAGSIGPEPGMTSLLSGGKGWHSFVQTLLREREYVQVAQLWAAGNEIDWDLCQEGTNPGRIPLPPYPFARERYWLPGTDPGIGATQQHPYRSPSPAKLHPCIDRNTSTLREQKYSTLLSGDEYYLRDHVIGNRKILPAAVYLEMARAAAELAGEQAVAKITNVLWVKPLAAGSDIQTVDICMHPERNEVAIEFVTHAADGPIIHAQGRVTFSADRPEQAKAEWIDIESIKHRTVQFGIDDAMYRELRQNGIEFGASFRTQRDVYRNESEVLAYLELPSSLQEGFADYGLHPVLIDGALQSAAHLAQRKANGTGALLLPFAMEELKMNGPIPAQCYAYVTLSHTTASVNPELQSYDIRIADIDGRVVASIQSYSVREFHPTEVEASATGTPALENRGADASDAAIRDLLSRLEKGELRVEEVNRLLEVL